MDLESGLFAGHGSGAEHRTTGQRAWCHECSEWCYPHDPCGQPKCCAAHTDNSDWDAARARIEELTRERNEALRVRDEIWAWIERLADRVPDRYDSDHGGDDWLVGRRS